MKTRLSVSLVRIAIGASLFLLSGSLVRAAGTHAKSDTAAQRLAAEGRVSVHAAGPYVERGTFLIQVMAKLGRPDRKLPDGTWLYHGRQIEGSDARGTLVVQFRHGRVLDMSLVAPSVAAAMQSRPAGTTASQLAKR